MFEHLSDHYSGNDSGSIAGPGSADWAQLNKALSAGSGAGLSSTGGRALVMEDLESELKMVTFGENQFANTIFRRLKANPEVARAIMHEFITVQGYGETGVFSPETTTSLQSSDMELQRGYVQVRFLRNKRAYTHVTDFVQGTDHGRAERLQVMAATQFLTSMVEKYIWRGDNTMSPDEWNGVYAQAASNGRVQNLAGQNLTKQILDYGAAQIAGDNGYGVPSDLFCPISVQQGLDNTLIGNNDRIIFPVNQGVPAYQGNGNPPIGGVTAGHPVAGYRSSFGEIKFNPENFTVLRRYPAYSKTATAEIFTHQNFAASVPTTFTCTASGTGGGFTGTGIGGANTGGGNGNGFNGAYAGAYYWRVSAASSLGESIPAAATSATVVSGGKCTLNWDAMPGATYYNVFRTRCGEGTTQVNGQSTCQLIARVAAQAGNTGTQVFIDTNQQIAGCGTAFMVDLASSGELASLGWAQLAPLSRYQLPMLDTVYQWMHFLYGALLMYNPNKIWVFDNVGPAA